MGSMADELAEEYLAEGTPSIDSTGIADELASEYLGTSTNTKDMAQELANDYSTAEPKEQTAKPADTKVAQNLPTTVGIGPAQIEVDKDTAAFFVGMGHMMSDTYRGAKQMLGIDVEEEKFNQDVMNQLYASEEYGGNALGGAIVGAVADPITAVAAPLALAKATKLNSLVKAASASEKAIKANPIKAGAALGAAYGGTGYVDEENGQTRLTNAMYGGLFGGALSGTLVGTMKATKAYSSAAESRAANSTIDNANRLISQHWADLGTGKGNKARAIDLAYKQMGATEESIAKAILKSGRKPDVKSVKAARQNVEDLESNMTASYIAKYKDLKMSTSEAMAKAGKGFNEYLEPMSSTLKRIAPPVYKAVKNFDRTSHEKYGAAIRAVHPFVDTLNQLQKTQPEMFKVVDRALSSESPKKVREALKQAGGETLVKDYKAVKEILDGHYKELKTAGYDLKRSKAYFPRVVSDLDGLAKLEDINFKNILNKAKKDNGGVPLTPRQIETLLDGIPFNGSRARKAKAKTGSGVHKRTIRGELDDEVRQFYASPQEALLQNLRSTIDDIEMRKMFKDMGHKGKPKVDGTDLESSAESIVGKHLQGLPFEDQQKVIEILSARFGPGTATMHKGWQRFRNVTNMSLLGNPLAAATQFGDLAFAAHKFGYLNTAKAIFGPKYVDNNMMGILTAATDLVATPSATSRALDWSLKWSGFKAVDKLGKETNMNAALKYYKDLVTTTGKSKKKREGDFKEFNDKWNGYFTKDELLEVTRDLKLLTKKDMKEGRIPDKVKEVLWHELSDVQPIAISEMPLKYAQNPNGRMLYMLKSFTIKRLDYMRRAITEAPDKATATKRLAHAAILFSAADTGIDAFKDIAREGPNVEFDIESDYIDNLLSFIGANKYMIDDISSDPLSGVIGAVSPPGIIPEKAFKLLTEGDVTGIGEALPIVGPWLRDND